MESEESKRRRKEDPSVSPSGLLLDPFSKPEDVGTLRVYARVKPLLPHEEDVEERPQLSFSGREIISHPPGGSTFRQHFLFSELFPPSVSQGELFDRMVRPRVREFLSGSNELLFTYGASSSGKTFTVQGTPEQPGLLPRCLDLIFSSLVPETFLSVGPLMPSGFDAVARISSHSLILEQKKEVLSLGRLLTEPENPEVSSGCSPSQGNESAQSLATMFPSLRDRHKETCPLEGVHQEGLFYSLWVSFAEIYNENIYDLFEKIPLAGKKDPPRRHPLRLAEDRRGSIYIKGLKEVHVASADEAYQLLLIGRKNLQFATTKLNHNSSRSHCIFTIKMMKFCDLKDPRYGRVSILSFCDLAGSERIKKTSTDGKQRQKETGNINASLLVLGRVMKTLRDNQAQRDVKKHSIVPYRDSKLTRLLQVFFKGKGQASMIVNISQSPYLSEETLQALKFAAITSKIKYVKETTKVHKRRSTFSSIMLQRKLNPDLVGRGSIAWENPVISSTLCPPPASPFPETEEVSTTATGEDSTTTTLGTTFASSATSSALQEEEDQYEALTNLVEELKDKLKEQKRVNLSMESDIRAELCKKFSDMMVKSEEDWQKRLESTTDRLEDLSEWRLAQMENAYKECRKRKRFEADESGVSHRIVNLESALESKELELEENNMQLKAMKETHGSLVGSRKKLQEELTSLKFENEEAKSRLGRLQEQIHSLNQEKKTNAIAIESLTSNPIIVDLRGQLSDAKKKAAKKTEEVTYLKKLLDEAGEEFLAKDEESTKLASELDTLKAESTQLSLALNDAQREYSVLISESNHRQEENESLEEQVIGFRTEITDLLAEKSQLLLELSNLKEEKLTSCQRLERDVILKDSHENEKILERRIQDLENENKKIKSERRTYESQVELRIEDLQFTLQNALETSEAILAKNKDLKSKVSLLESEVNVLGSLSSPTVVKKRPNIQDMSILETKEFEKFEHNALTEELEIAQRKLAENEALMAQKEIILQQKEDVIARQETQIKEITSKSEEQESRNNQEQDILAQKENIITEKEAVIAQNDAKIEEMKTLVDDLKKKLQDNSTEIAEGKDAIISEKDEKVSAAKTEIEDLKAKIKDLQVTSDKNSEKKKKYLHQLEDIIVDNNYAISQLEEELMKYKEKEETSAQKAEEALPSLSEEAIDSLRLELEDLKKSLEAQEKTLKKTEDEKSRREKDLNDEIENLRVSKLRIKSSEDEKTRVLSEKENEISTLQGEIKRLIQEDCKMRERTQEQSSEIKTLEKELKKHNEGISAGDSKDIEVLGKRIGEQQNLIDSLQSQLKSKEKEENLIGILKDELDLKNSEITHLSEKVSKLESSSIHPSELLRLQDKVSQLEQEAQSKDDEIRQTREEREQTMNNFSKLIKAKEDELVRLKQESTRIRDVIIRSSPIKQSDVSSLKTELEKREAFIKELEVKVEKTLDVKINEDEQSLKSEIDSLKGFISQNNISHSKELESLKKSHNKILREYKVANRDLQKKLGPEASLPEETFSKSMLEVDETLDAYASPLQKPRSRGRGRKGQKTPKVMVSSPAPLANEDDHDSAGDENVPLNSTAKSTRSSRTARKTKNKINPSTLNLSDAETPSRGRNKSKSSDTPCPEISPGNTFVEPTPRRSTRKTLYNPGKLEAFSPVDDLNETTSTPHTIVNRQLRSRRKK